MVLRLDDAATVLGLVASFLGVMGGLFVVLRYIIRAETAELRPNHGGSIKDVIHILDERTAATEAKLDEHMADSKIRIKRGDQVETELRQTIGKLADAMQTVAASTPPQHEEE